MTAVYQALVAVLTADAEAVAALLGSVPDRSMRQNLRRLLGEAWSSSSALPHPVWLDNASRAAPHKAGVRAAEAAAADQGDEWQRLCALQQALERSRRQLEPSWRPGRTGRARRRWLATRTVGVVAARAARLQRQIADHTGARLALSAARLAWWEARWSHESPGSVAVVRPAAAQSDRLDLPLLRKRGAGEGG